MVCILISGCSPNKMVIEDQPELVGYEQSSSDLIDSSINGSITAANNSEENSKMTMEQLREINKFNYEHYNFSGLFENDKLSKKEAQEQVFENNVKCFAFYYHQGMTPVGIIYDNRYQKMYFSSSTGGGFYIDSANNMKNIVELTPQDLSGLENKLQEVNFHNWSGNWNDSSLFSAADATFVWTVALEYNDGTIERYSGSALGGGAEKKFPEGFEELKSYLFHLMDTLPEERELLEAEVYME